MKKWLSLFVITIMLCTTCGCGAHKDESVDKTDVYDAFESKDMEVGDVEASTFVEEDSQPNVEEMDYASVSWKCIYTPGGEWPWDKTNSEDCIWGSVGVNVFGSASEVVEYCEQYKNYFDFGEFKDVLVPYDNEWFEKNVLILIPLSGPSTKLSMDYSIQNVRRLEDRLEVSILGSYYQPSGDSVIGMWHTLIEMPKTEMESITSIDAIKSIYWPEDPLLENIESAKNEKIDTKMFYLNGNLYVRDETVDSLKLPDSATFAGAIIFVDNYNKPDREFGASNLSSADKVYVDKEDYKYAYIRECISNSVVRFLLVE